MLSFLHDSQNISNILSEVFAIVSSTEEVAILHVLVLTVHVRTFHEMNFRGFIYALNDYILKTLYTQYTYKERKTVKNVFSMSKYNIFFVLLLMTSRLEDYD
jgi:hypothetical protein